jgi:hypothetical protein
MTKRREKHGWQKGQRIQLHDLLGALGNDVITVESFWRRMATAKMTSDDILRYCDEETRWMPTKNDGHRT